VGQVPVPRSTRPGMTPAWTGACAPPIRSRASCPMTRPPSWFAGSRRTWWVTAPGRCRRAVGDAAAPRSRSWPRRCCCVWPSARQASPSGWPPGPVSTAQGSARRTPASTSSAPPPTTVRRSSPYARRTSRSRQVLTGGRPSTSSRRWTCASRPTCRPPPSRTTTPGTRPAPGKRNGWPAGAPATRVASAPPPRCWPRRARGRTPVPTRPAAPGGHGTRSPRPPRTVSRPAPPRRQGQLPAVVDPEQ
jgi:hypothetical protein